MSCSLICSQSPSEKLSLCHLINKQVLDVHGGMPGPNPRIFVPGVSHDPSDVIPGNETTITLDGIAAVDRETELQAGTYKAAVELVEGARRLHDGLSAVEQIGTLLLLLLLLS